MTSQTRATLKGYFNTNDQPTEAQFADLIDSAVNVADTSPGVGTDGYGLVWDNATSTFVLRAPFAGLLATGATVGATAQAQAFTLGVVVPSGASTGSIKLVYLTGAGDSRSWKVQNDHVVYGDFAILSQTAQGTTFDLPRLYCAPSGSWGIGTTNPVLGDGTFASPLTLQTASSNGNVLVMRKPDASNFTQGVWMQDKASPSGWFLGVNSVGAFCVGYGNEAAETSSIQAGYSYPKFAVTSAGDIRLGSIVPRRQNAVYCLGDSLTANPTYPGKLATLLGTPWAVRNFGISGNTTTDMAARIDAHCLQAGDGEYIVILGGINDVALDVAAVTIEANLQAMYDAASASGFTVIACTITPFKTSPYWSSDRQTVLDAVNTWILNTATNVDYRVDAYSVMEDPGAADALLAAYDSGDHLHLSTAGYELLGTTIHAALTWTASTADVIVNASGGPIGLNQSLLSTDDVTFHDISVSGTLDMPIWRPLVDSSSALSVQNVAGDKTLMTFDTANGTVGINSTSLAGATVAIAGRRVGAGDSYGLFYLGGKSDCVGTCSGWGVASNVYNYAMTANSTAYRLLGLQTGIGTYAAPGLTATVTVGFGLLIEAPGASGGGTHSVGSNYGIFVNNQGNASVGTAVGLEIAGQSGAGENWAFRSGSGKHQIGDSAATLAVLGAAPIAQIAHVANPSGGATVDAEARSAINAILATLEGFGFHATA